MKYGVVVFPGSNCDNDAFYAASENSRAEAQFLWHKDTSIPQDLDVIILPGGFSYGDYLRCGAIARFSPIMREVVDFASKGGLVMGICNGFQILVEAGLLPGVLLKNTSQNFICRDVFLKTVNFHAVYVLAFRAGNSADAAGAIRHGITVLKERRFVDDEDEEDEEDEDDDEHLETSRV